ncbi:MAG: 1-phosphofructokinase [Atopobiaceae bacterium]|jgi:tagatose 6-phosphate kinase
MITTVTLNTSIDKAYSIEGDLEVGTVMRVTSCIDNAGGKGLNASRAVATAGEDVVATGFVGGNNGRLLCELLEADGISQEFVQVDSETRCCINVLEPSGRSTEFLEPGRPVTNDDLARLAAKVRELALRSSVVTFSGSAPKGVSTGVYATLIEQAKIAGASVILDTSGDLLARGIEAKPTMVKPNTDEIAQLLGRTVSTPEEVVDAAREMHTSGIDQVVVSLGSKGALMACEDGVFQGTPPKIEVVNPVGSGDTMVGTFAAAMSRGLSPVDQLRFAMACATANCLTPSTGHFDLETANRLAKEVRIEKVG